MTPGYVTTASGIINNENDRGVFQFNLPGTNNFRLSATPQNVGSGNQGANVDIKVALLDENADTVGRYNPADLLNAGIDTNLNAGIYYLVVDGVANANLSDYGSLGFYSLSAQILTVLPVHRLVLTGRTSEGEHELHWNYFADEAIKEIHIESSADGKHFNFLTKLTKEKRALSWTPLDNEGIHYRVKVIVSSDERAYYSNIVVLRDRVSGRSIEIMNRIVQDNINLSVDKNYQYQMIDEMGRVLQTGILREGSNQVAATRLKPGMFFLKLYYQSESHTEKLIKR